MKTANLCYKCGAKLSSAYTLRQVHGGVCNKVDCQECGRRRYGATYEIELYKEAQSGVENLAPDRLRELIEAERYGRLVVMQEDEVVMEEAGWKETVEGRALEIAAIILDRAGFCVDKCRITCREYIDGKADCKECMKKWLLEKAGEELET